MTESTSTGWELSMVSPCAQTHVRSVYKPIYGLENLLPLIDASLFLAHTSPYAKKAHVSSPSGGVAEMT